jgi:hypothetical protein
MMTALAIFGPNGHGPDEPPFHVHAVGCADTFRRRYATCEYYKEDFDSLRELVESYYDGQLQDNADDPAGWGEWEAYIDEFKVFPCVKGLVDVAAVP